MVTSSTRLDLISPFFEYLFPEWDTAKLILTSLATIFLLGVGGQWLAWRLRVPSILVVLPLGILAGPVFGVLVPDKLFGDLLLPLVSLSVAIILFEGSLSLRLNDFREIGGPLVRLLTVGVVATFALCALAAYFLLGFKLGPSLLLGAILVVTGPTVIGPLLRHIRPLGKVGPIARWEGIVIDPIGAVLSVLVFEAAEAVHAAEYRQATMTASWELSKTVIIAVVVGTTLTWILTQLLRRHWIADHLQSPVALMIVLAAFTVSNLFQHESGLATVTLMGVLLANQPALRIKHIVEFKENLSVLLISSLFIVLAARLRLEDFTTLGWRGLLFLAFIICVARPVCVFVSTVGTELSWRERGFLSWLAPRGIVAAAVASVFELDADAGGNQLVAATFLVIIGTVCVYGLTTGALARWLGLSVRDPQGVLIGSAHAGARAIAHSLANVDIPVMLVDSNPANISTARMEGLSTMYANVLSETTTEDLDLGGIGRFLALTPNDEVNSLACHRFSELFGRANVYRLVPHGEGSQRKETSAELLEGRSLFGADVTYRRLDERFEQGAIVKTTRLSEKFDYAAFRQQYGDSTLLLFVIDGSGRLAISTADRDLSPRPGSQVIALVDPIPNDEAIPKAES